MASISLNKSIYFIIIAILIVIISIFASNIDSFKKDLEENTKTISCLEEDNRKIISENDCYYEYNGTPLLLKFDNVLPNKVCCQLKQ